MTAQAPESFIRTLQTAADRIELDSGDWLYDLFSSIWERYSCSDPDRCPSRPAWDKAREDMFELLAPKADRLVSDMLAELVATTAIAFAEYATANPEAPRATVEPVR